MRKFSFVFAVLATATLVACGGGGGGGSSATMPLNPQTVGHSVPYYTPILVPTTVTPLVNSGLNDAPIVGGFAGDVTGTGAQNFVIAGRHSQGFTTSTHKNSQIAMFGWTGGTLVDQTAQWFDPGANVITGTEPSVSFAKLTNSGYSDMIVAACTDANSDATAAASVFFSDGTKFTRYDIALPFIWSHGSTVASLSNDGKTDLVFTDYGSKTTIAFNNGDRTFTTHRQNQGTATLWGESSVAAADFTARGANASDNGTGQRQLVFTDINATGGGTAVYSWAISGAKNVQADDLTFTKLTDLPTSRLASTTVRSSEGILWSSYNFGTGNTTTNNTHAPDHNIRALTFDFNHDGFQDILVISRPWQTNDTYPVHSELQFLLNNGSGVVNSSTFSDVTDTTRVGYNTQINATYNPQIIANMFGAGADAIILAGASQYGTTTSSQILVRDPVTNKYTATNQNILNDFVTQSQALLGTVRTNNGVNIINDVNGTQYLVTSFNYDSGGTVKTAVYMSNLGAKTVTATMASDAIHAAWPWMSPAQVNTVMSTTATSYLNFGGRILDMDTILNPVGGLGVVGTNKITVMPLMGYLAGVKLTGAAASVTALDGLGRNFQVNLSGATGPITSNTWSNTLNLTDNTATSQGQYLVNSTITAHGMTYSDSTEQNYTVGTPAMHITDKLTVNGQFTNLSFNPWLQFDGMWGKTTGSQIFETVFTHKDREWGAQLGYMHVSTSFTPGLITKVSDIQAMWAEVGYTAKKFSIYGGVKPVILAGYVEANLPTSIDAQGKLMYTTTRMGMQSSIVTYIRALFRDKLTRNMSYSLAGDMLNTGEYRAQAELKMDFQ